MAAYAVLVHPSANRVYAAAAPELAAAELRAVAELTGAPVGAVEVVELGGVPYLTCTAPAPSVPAGLSSALAVFERDGDLLRPLRRAGAPRWDDDLVTIPRYAGRTNEQLTALLVHLAVTASGAGARARVLDPLCGRGTTLHVAVRAGHDVAGIDQDSKDVEAYLSFFTTWLKQKRAKHTVRREGPRTTISFAPAKEDHRQQSVVVVGDTADAPRHLGRSSVDAVVADLPYGVHHGSTAGGELRRGPADLLAVALPAWRQVLRGGGGLALSWNTKVLPRPAMEDALGDAGLVVATGERFAHRVDQAVERDVVVARKPGG